MSVSIYFGVYLAIGLVVCAIILYTTYKYTKYVPIEAFIFGILCWPYEVYTYVVDYFTKRNFRNPFYRRKS